MSLERPSPSNVGLGMTNATNRSIDAAKSLGGAAKSSNETSVSSAENPAPDSDGNGNTAMTRPHPAGAADFAGRDPPMSTDHDPDHRGPFGSRLPRLQSKNASAPDDYRNASGLDHPAESEHDHALQKLHGEAEGITKRALAESNDHAKGN